VDFFTKHDKIADSKMKNEIACKCIEGAYNYIFSIHKEKMTEFENL